MKPDVDFLVTRLAQKFRSLPAVPPQFVEPMRCKLVNDLPSGNQWQYEIKFDGYRALAIKDGNRVDLISRNEKRLTDRFAAIAKSLRSLPVQKAVLDGEIVALDEKGRPSFQTLQNAKTTTANIFYYAFDMINLEGHSLVDLPLTERKDILASAFLDVPNPLRLSTEIHGTPTKLIDQFSKLGLEGIVAKRRDSTYKPGDRGGAWVKFKLNCEQEFVIGGYLVGGTPFDALLVGVYEGRKLVYVAKIRNGFVPATRARVWDRLREFETKKRSFDELPISKRGRWGEGFTAEDLEQSRWVKPKLVCQVGFTEWTNAGHLRHSKFVALREDKEPREVVREKPE